MKSYKNGLNTIGMSRVAIAAAVTLYAAMACAQPDLNAAQTAPGWKAPASSARLLLAQDPTRDCPESATLGCRAGFRGRGWDSGPAECIRRQRRAGWRERRGCGRSGGR
jgi:hypothetical protein